MQHLSHHASESCHQGPLFQCDALSVSVCMHFLLGHWLRKAKLLETAVHCTVTCTSSTIFPFFVCEKLHKISFRSLAWVASDIEEVEELEEELSSSTFSPLAFACFLIFFCNFFLAMLETDTIKSNNSSYHGIIKPSNHGRVKIESKTDSQGLTKDLSLLLEFQKLLFQFGFLFHSLHFFHHSLGVLHQVLGVQIFTGRL